jgi:hypothetical protein
MGKTHKQFNFLHMTVIYFNYKRVIFIISSDRNLTLIDYRCGINGIKTITYQNICEAGAVKLRINII